jgi:DNA excision repair protein ERCC-2
VLEELRKLQAYQEQELGKQAQILALGLSSRKNLCIHPKISGEGSRENVDAGCRKLTATWVRTAAADNPDIELCDFFEGYEKKGADALLPAGVYTLHDMKVGERCAWCLGQLR